MFRSGIRIPASGPGLDEPHQIVGAERLGTEKALCDRAAGPAEEIGLILCLDNLGDDAQPQGFAQGQDRMCDRGVVDVFRKPVAKDLFIFNAPIGSRFRSANEEEKAPKWSMESSTPSRSMR